MAQVEVFFVFLEEPFDGWNAMIDGVLPESGVFLDEFVRVFGAMLIGNHGEIEAKVARHHDGALGGLDASSVTVVGEADIGG